jgi:hypothetical protein
MNRLEIKLRDKEDKEFLLCEFRKSSFTYRCLYSSEAAFSLSSWDVFESYEHKERELAFLSSKKFNNSDEGDVKERMDMKEKVDVKERDQANGSRREEMVNNTKEMNAGSANKK